MAHSKILPGIFFVLLLSFLGLFLGTLIGAYFVPKGSGLAGPAIALGYGVVGLVTATVAGIILARRLAYSRLRSALIGVAIVALLACGWLVYRVSVIKQEVESTALGLRKGTGTARVSMDFFITVV